MIVCASCGKEQDEGQSELLCKFCSNEYNNNTTVASHILYQKRIQDIALMTTDYDKDPFVLEKCEDALTVLYSVLKEREEFYPPLNGEDDSSIVRHGISMHLDHFIETLSGALRFTHEHEFALPCDLVQSVVNVLSYIFRTSEYANSHRVSHTSVECVERESLHILPMLAQRMDEIAEEVVEVGVSEEVLEVMEGEIDEVNKLLESIHELMTRAIISVPFETALLALLSLQQSTLERLDSLDIKNATYALGLYTTLCIETIKMEARDFENPMDQLDDVALDSILYSLESLSRIIEELSIHDDFRAVTSHVEPMISRLNHDLLESSRGEEVNNQKDMWRKLLDGSVDRSEFARRLQTCANCGKGREENVDLVNCLCDMIRHCSSECEEAFFASSHEMECNKVIFSMTCTACCNKREWEVELQTCNKCKLFAYCSEDCQMSKLPDMCRTLEADLLLPCLLSVSSSCFRTKLIGLEQENEIWIRIIR